MPNRDDFSTPVKTELERRVASVCSKSGCGQVTRGPKRGEPDTSVSIGEAGHITAASEGGPRYDPNMTLEERVSFTNGIWLCRGCHKIVDNDFSPFPPETLREWKSAAEELARNAVEFGEARTSHPALVAILHKSMEVIPDGALRNSMPGIFDAPGNVEVVINSCDLYAGGTLNDPQEAMRRQVLKRNELYAVLEDHPLVDIAYYGIAHIPLAFHFGYLMSTKIAPYFAEKDRTTNAWRWLTAKDATVLPVVHMPEDGWQSATDAIIRIGISYPVVAGQTEPVVRSPATFGLGIEHPRLDKITSRKEVEAMAGKFREILDKITTGTSVRKIHVFASVPMPIAFALGQQISSSIHPAVVVYNYRQQDTPNYRWGLRMTDDVGASDVVVVNQ